MQCATLGQHDSSHRQHHGQGGDKDRAGPALPALIVLLRRGRGGGRWRAVVLAAAHRERVELGII